MEVLIQPIITEKISAQSEKLNRFGFLVKRDANKIEIKTAVEKRYNVTVTSVNTQIYMGKFKSRYTKKGIQNGRTNHFKKALVTIKQGESIDFFSNI
jgi:large subunit ribosomal protein L23